MGKQGKVARPDSGRPVVEVVDLFCGVGALSYGLSRAGFKIVAGYDVDSRCKHAFEKNSGGSFFASDVSKLKAEEIRSKFSAEAVSVLAGCAPCQPFSTYKQRYEEDPRWSLVAKFAALAVEVGADFVTMENVPALLKYKDGKVFASFKRRLIRAGYEVYWTVANCEQFGVPQKRKRLVVIASKSGGIEGLLPTHPVPVSVGDAIGSLPELSAGQADPADRLHAAAALSPLNLKRIRASRPGGTWHDWPASLRARCHRRSTGQTYAAVYSRMKWDEPAPTMTTQCYGYGSGRFGHPEQDRAISLREAAILQSFPDDYDFLPSEERISFVELGRWIGNAVPVRLAEAIGHSIGNAVERCEHGKR